MQKSFKTKRVVYRRFVSVISLMLAAAMLTVCTGCSTATGGTDYGFSYSLTADPKNLDPQMASDNNSLLVIKNMFEGLMRVGSDGDLIPGVATSYEVNDDSTEYVFHLRKDAKWANGEPVTAYDFEFAWKRALDPDTKSTTCLSLYCIRNAEAINKGEADKDTLGITIIDAHTLKVLLEYSYAEFPLQTTLAVYMPCNQTFFESTNGHYGLDNDFVMSNGPFAFSTESKAWNHDNYVRMMRNPNYSGENTCKPHVLYLGVRHGNVDYFSLLDETVEAAKIESHNVKKLEESDYLTYSYTDRTWGILFNTESLGFSEAYVRQGFAMCVDPNVYKDYLADNTEVAYDIVPPATKLNGYIYRELAGSGMKIKADKAKAYDLMKQGLAHIGRTSMPEITVICPNDENVVEMMQQVVQQWQDNLLLYCNLEPLDESTLNNRVNIKDYQIALWCLAPTKDGPLNCLQTFDSGTYLNPASLKSKGYDHLIDLASAQTNTEDILAPLVAAEQYLNNMAIFYPMYYETTYYATWDTVEGIYFSPFDGTADFCNALCYEDQ